MAKNYWLAKSEPSVFSIDDLEKSENQITFWDGVRNYQARNFIRDDMKKGDMFLFYHSNADTIGVAGLCEIVREAYPDFSAFDPEDKHYDPKSDKDNPRWFMVDIKLIKKFKRIITIGELKENPKLQDMLVIRRGNRLSVTSVTEAEFREILRMAEEDV